MTNRCYLAHSVRLILCVWTKGHHLFHQPPDFDAQPDTHCFGGCDIDNWSSCKRFRARSPCLPLVVLTVLLVRACRGPSQINDAAFFCFKFVLSQSLVTRKLPVLCSSKSSSRLYLPTSFNTNSLNGMQWVSCLDYNQKMRLNTHTETTIIYCCEAFNFHAIVTTKQVYMLTSPG